MIAAFSSAPLYHHCANINKNSSNNSTENYGYGIESWKASKWNQNHLCVSQVKYGVCVFVCVSKEKEENDKKLLAGM